MVSNRVFIASLFLIRLHKILVSMSMEECSLEMWLIWSPVEKGEPAIIGRAVPVVHALPRLCTQPR